MKLLHKIRKAIREGGLSLFWLRARWKVKSIVAGESIRSHFSHSLDRGYPTEEIRIDEFTPTREDIYITERIMAALRRALADDPRRNSTEIKDLWDIIQRDQFNDFFEAYRSGDTRRVAAYLCNMHRHSLGHGISDFSIEHYNAVSPKLRKQHTALIKDKMVSFGEAVGSVPYAEAGENGSLYVDPGALVQSIERAVGIDITPPNIDGGVVKIQMGKGHFSLRDIYSSYTAWRINQILHGKEGALCEIGAGLGKTALYAYRFGFVDYSIFDLPIANVAQAWYLIKSGIRVVLYGENKQPAGSVKILPYWAYVPDKKYVLTLNADSFPEISEDIVRRYLETIKRTTTDYFLSINQEQGAPYWQDRSKSHLIVPQLISSVGGFWRIYRFPFWLRRG